MHLVKDRERHLRDLHPEGPDGDVVLDLDERVPSNARDPSVDPEPATFSDS